MEFIPTKEITSKVSEWLGMDASDESNIMNNMGLMLIIGVLILIVVVALIVASCFVQHSYSAYKTYQGIKESIFYNAFLRYMLQSVLKIGLASATTLSAISWSNFRTASLLSVVSGSVILLLMGTSPIIFGLALHRNFEKLPRPSTKKAIGTIYLSIKDQNKVALTYSSVFMLRRLIFIGITFGMPDVPSL